jgi:acyl-CoA reductase-like NAD-dependent aldehyde dehydrogenase
MPVKSVWRSSEFYVHESVYDEFCVEIAKLAQAAVVDDGAKQGTTVGPMQNKMQFDKVSALLADASASGTVLAGGAPIDRPGYFIPPTIIADLDDLRWYVKSNLTSSASVEI